MELYPTQIWAPHFIVMALLILLRNLINTAAIAEKVTCARAGEEDSELKAGGVASCRVSLGGTSAGECLPPRGAQQDIRENSHVSIYEVKFARARCDMSTMCRCDVEQCSLVVENAMMDVLPCRILEYIFFSRYVRLVLKTRCKCHYCEPKPTWVRLVVV